MFDKFHEECGVVAIYGHPEAAKLAYLGLYALQHRGQESAGICTSDGAEVYCHKAMGHVADIFTSRGAGDAAGRAGHRPHALLHRRRHGAAERAAVFGGLQQGPRGGGAQRQHHQRRRTARATWSARGAIFQASSDTEVILHLVAHSSRAHPGGRAARRAAATGRRVLAGVSGRRTASSWRAIRTASARWPWAKWKSPAAASATSSPRKPAPST